jgi:hypothetical protein
VSISTNSTFHVAALGERADLLGIADVGHVRQAVGLCAPVEDGVGGERPAAATHGHGPRQNRFASTAPDSSGRGGASRNIARARGERGYTARPMDTRASRSNRLVAWILIALAAPIAGCQRDPLERARIFKRRKVESSADLLREVLKKRPEDPEANFRYGVALIASGQHSLALWSLRKAMESPSGWSRPAFRSRRPRSGSGTTTRRSRPRRACSRSKPDLVDALLCVRKRACDRDAST